MGQLPTPLSDRPGDPVYRKFGAVALACKRAFDLVVALTALVLLAPLFVVIAVLIKLDSSGPVFFRQVRVGRHRRRFLMWKFRKMYHNLPAQGPSLTGRYDTRMTRIGRILERTKLDELPQLFNVLTGDMSAVGPRPEVPPFVQHYPGDWDRVLSVKPGIVGPCQVRFRNESELFPAGCRDVEGYYVSHILPAKLTLDTAYASAYSFVADVFILAHAVLAAVGGVITKQTILNRRWQILNTVVLSVAGLVATLVSARLLAATLTPVSLWWIVLFAALSKPACVIAFKIPKALATSITADDLLRCCWCAAVSGALTGCAMLFAGFRDVGRSVLLADTVLFLTFLVVYKLTCHNLYVCFFRPHSRELWRHVLLTSLVLGPFSMAAALTARHGLTVWARPHAVVLLLLALLIRPGVVLLKPVSARGGGASRLLREWGKIFFGSLVGSAAIVSGALLLNERGIGRLDVACDSVLYFLLTSWVVYRYRGLGRWPTPEQDGQTDALKEKLLIVGDGLELGGYVSALSALPEHHFEVVGALSTRRGQRTNMAGGVLVLGEMADAPEVVRALGVTRVVVLDVDISDAALDELRAGCALGGDQVLRVEILSPFMRLWRKDAPEMDYRGPVQRWEPKTAFGISGSPSS